MAEDTPLPVDDDSSFKLALTEISSLNECHAFLGKFQFYCDALNNNEDFHKSEGIRYFDKWTISGAWIDLNSDGRLDFIFTTLSGYHCGTHNCPFYLIVDDVNGIGYNKVTRDGLPAYSGLPSADGVGPVIIVSGGQSVVGLRFFGLGKLSNQTVIPPESKGLQK